MNPHDRQCRGAVQHSWTINTIFTPKSCPADHSTIQRMRHVDQTPANVIQCQSNKVAVNTECMTQDFSQTNPVEPRTWKENETEDLQFAAWSSKLDTHLLHV
jgi:hypothetical protein